MKNERIELFIYVNVINKSKATYGLYLKYRFNVLVMDCVKFKLDGEYDPLSTNSNCFNVGEVNFTLILLIQLSGLLFESCVAQPPIVIVALLLSPNCH